MKLNPKQQEAYDLVMSENTDGEMLSLIGSGGTGKSFTTATIVRDYKGVVTVTALSHKAKKVLMAEGIRGVKTIHSFLGLVMQRHGYSMKLVSTNKEPERTDLLVVDEASMLTNHMYTMIQQALTKGLYRKVLLVYDEMQLPPVGDTINLDNKGHQTVLLTQQMRQDDSQKELADYLNRIRASIAGGELDLSNPPPEVEYIEDFNEFAEKYKECETDKIILAHRNTCVNSYNGNISSNARFMVNDSVVLDKPLQPFNNQDTVTIAKIVEEEDRYQIWFHELSAELSVYHYKSGAAKDRDLAQADKDGGNSTYWELEDRCFDLKHLYAQTVFKSQGSGYTTVFIDGTDIMNAHYQDKTKYNHPISHNLMVRLLYVAISRMREKCYIFTGDKRNYPKLKPKKNWR